MALRWPAAIFIMSMVVSADAQVPADFLKEARETDIFINLTPARACQITREEIRAEIVNRAVPAGLRIGRNSALSVEVTITTAERNGLCATSFRLSLLSLYSLVSPTGNNFTAFVPIIERGSVMTSGSLIYKDSLFSAMRRDLDFILAQWREANAGAEFVRQAPPASSGPNVGTVQRRLSALGLYRGAADNNFGPATRAAVQEFQRSNQMPATGDLDLETMRKLFP